MVKVACFIVSLVFTLSSVLGHYEGDCQEGWSSCDASLWVSPKYNPQDPLSSYTPGDIRGPLEYEIKFSCRGRRNGYYADLDHSCKVWHYCNTTREINPYNGLATWTYTHFSYACLEEGTRYDQVQKECVPEPKSIVRCRDSEFYYPTGDYVYDVPVASNNRLVPVRCPTSVSDVKCSIQKDHINLQGCPESPGAIVKFYSSLTDLLPSPVNENDVATTQAPAITLYNNRGDIVVPSDSGEVAPVPVDVPVAVPVAPVSPVDQPTLYHHHPEHVASVPAAPAPAQPLPDSVLSGRKMPQGTKNVYAPSSGRKIASPAHAGRKSVVQSYTNQYVDGDQLIFPRRLSQPLVVPTIAAAVVPLRDVAFEPVPVASSNTSESAEADFLGLPVGSTKILGDKIDTSFDCSGRAYGYYADVKNQCKVYHVCSPKTDEFGVRFYEHFSFVCAEGLIFDQRKITCVPGREASHQCSDSEKYFEKTSEQFHKEHESFVANKKVAVTEAPVNPPAAPVTVAPGPSVTGRTLTIIRVKSIEPEVDAPKQYSKVNAPGKSVGPPRVFLKEPTVPTNVQNDEYDHDAEEVALRGDQGHAVREEQVNEPAPVSTASPPPPPSPRPAAKSPVAPKRPVNYGVKSAHPASTKRYHASRPVVHSPVKKQYVPVAPVAPERRVVYRLKKGNRAPVSYTGQAAPYLGERKIAYTPQITQQASPVNPSHQVRRIQHSPSISQGLASPVSPSSSGYISHNPAISQFIASPDTPAQGAQSVSHNPSVSQYVAPAASVPSGPQHVSHNPSISQYIGSPVAAPVAPQRISHNPSVSQYVAVPASQGSTGHVLSHNPSIVQYVGAPAAPTGETSISHAPLISQYMPELSSPYSSGSQSISHNPSIHQVIVRSDSSRPSARLNW